VGLYLFKLMSIYYLRKRKKGDEMLFLLEIFRSESTFLAYVFDDFGHPTRESPFVVVPR
jgi:hypothetical protein